MEAASKIEPLTAAKRGNVLGKNPIHSLVNRIPLSGKRLNRQERSRGGTIPKYAVNHADPLL